MEAMSRKEHKTKKITIPEQVADKHLLKESMMKKQDEIEAVVIGDMVGQVGEVNKEIFYAEVK